MLSWGIAKAGEIVQRNLIKLSQADSDLQRQWPKAPFIFGIKRLIALQEIGHLLLSQVGILPQIPDTEIHG